MTQNPKCSKGTETVYEELFEQWKNWNSAVYKVSDDGVHSLSEFTQAIGNLLKHDKEKHIFRGESQTYPTYLIPKIARKKPQTLVPYKTGKNLTTEEIREINGFRESQKAEELELGKNLAPNAVDWIPLAQHYGKSTRLMDLTRNAFVALYFACKSNSDLDGWVYVFWENSCRPQTKPRSNVNRRDIEQGIPDDYLELFEAWNRHPVYSGILHLFIPMQSVKLRIVHKRLHTQSSVFLWWHPILKPLGAELLHKNEKPTQGRYTPILVSNQSKERILQELDKNLDMRANTLFPPDKD